VIGIFFIIAAVIGMRNFGEMRTMMAREHSIMGPLVELLVGAALIYLPSSVEAGLNTFWQTTNPYAYLNSSETGEAASFVTAAYSVVQLIGTIAFIRGLLMLKAAGSERGGQPGMLGKALAHMGGGILCINIYNTLQVLEKTVGLAN
ncbi:MAG TPA: hypothetical protein VHA13_02325, partial [Gammaproteobacteria bacterium]|nr:hypothetical protein [Gammaproteobacteria bacterium]